MYGLFAIPTNLFVIVFLAKQFFRVLWENLGLKFTEEQEAYLAGKYQIKNDDRVYYRAFCDTINQPFKANNLKMNPESQKVEAKSL